MIRNGIKISPESLERMPDFVKRVRQDNDVIALLVFGGASQGKLKPLGDIDLAVLLSVKLSTEERLKKHLNLLDIANTVFGTDEIDLVVLNDAFPRFSHNIIKTGTLLFITDRNAYCDFRERNERQFDTDGKIPESLGSSVLGN